MTDVSCPEPQRILRMRLPGRPRATDTSVRDADLALLAKAGTHFLDTTHFDTVRFAPPPWAAPAFAQAAGDGALAYTGYRGHPAVLQALAQRLGSYMGLELDPRQHLVLTPGTQAGLFAALSSVVEYGQRVALLEPDYLFSERILRFLGAQVARVALRLEPGPAQPDLAALEQEFAQHGTRLLVFSHPNNPTGAVFPRPVLEAIAGLAQRYGVTVLVDELYSRLIYQGEFIHLASLPGMAGRTISLLGPSKTESLSGYRLGVVVAPADLCARIENVLSITALRAPAYAQHVLQPWLRDDHAWLAQRLLELRALRDTTLAALARLPWLRIQPQQGTAYAWVNVEALKLPGRQVAEALLTDAGVLVSPGYQFGPGCEGYFRLCYARDEAVWDQALAGITRVLNRLALDQGLPGVVA